MGLERGKESACKPRKQEAGARPIHTVWQNEEEQFIFDTALYQQLVKIF